MINYSQAVGTTAVQIIPVNADPRFQPRRYLRIVNSALAPGATAPVLWLSRVAGITPGPNVPGSYPLLPGASEEHAYPGYVPQGAIYAAADPSASAAIGVTAEVG